MSNDNKKRPISPVYAIYAVAILWLCWPLFLPLFAVIHYIPLIIAAVLLYKVVNNIIEKKNAPAADKSTAEKTEKVEKPVREKPKTTGNPQVDKLIKDRDLAIREMRRLNRNIKDEKISRQIDDLETTTTKIFDHVIAHPDQEKQIGKFLNYYLPTTMKLLNTYDRMGSQGVAGDNITGTMQKVEKTLDMIVSAFHKQLDTLFAGEALDVSTDITVMENLMKTEGLADDGMGRFTIKQE